MDDLRQACAAVAQRARHVRVRHAAIADYAASLPLADDVGEDEPSPAAARVDDVAAHWLTLDAINFGSGWFPTLHKPDGRSGYTTIAAAWDARFAADGPFTAAELTALDAATVADILGQDPAHELMALYAASLRNLGTRIDTEHDGSFMAPIAAADGSAVAFARRLGTWECFADSSRYDELTIPFLKRAQIAAADLARAGVARWHDADRLTMFADNLVPHVLRLDGVLQFTPELVAQIERGELIAHGGPEEVEIRACAVHAVELIVDAREGDIRPADVDQALWRRGQEPFSKARPRHRSRCTAY